MIRRVCYYTRRLGLYKGKWHGSWFICPAQNFTPLDNDTISHGAPDGILIQTPMHIISPGGLAMLSRLRDHPKFSYQPFSLELLVFLVLLARAVAGAVACASVACARLCVPSPWHPRAAALATSGMAPPKVGFVLGTALGVDFLEIGLTEVAHFLAIARIWAILSNDTSHVA